MVSSLTLNAIVSNVRVADFVRIEAKNGLFSRNGPQYGRGSGGSYTFVPH